MLIMLKDKLTRRRLLATTAASAAFIAMPHVRGAHAAGKLSIGFWDHWVPGANDTSKKLVEEWAEKEKVEIQIDYIPSQGNKLLLTTAAEAQARSGHDIMALSTWLPNDYAKSLEPVDDVMEPLIKQNGAVNETVKYLGRAQDHWIAVPATIGSQIKGPCSRIDLMKQHAGIDVQAMYPAGSPPKAENWTLDAFMKAAEACHKAGHAFGIGLGTTSDSVDTAGAVFHAHGAQLVDAKGNITVKSDPVRQALEYYTKLAKFFPPDAPAWDDASNKSAAKILLTHLSHPAAVEKLVAASGGYDLPSFANLTTLKTWAEEGPPKGTLYHYPNPHNHQTLSIAAAPAPPKIAVQIYVQGIMTKMTVRHLQGETMEKTLAWAESEVEGFMRT